MFLEPEDLTSLIDQEKIDAISDGDTEKLPNDITTAIADAKLYLSRFDVDDLFGKTGGDRDPILLQWVKDITLWYFMRKANGGIDWESAQQCYNDTIKALVRLQGSTTVPSGWKLATVASPTQGYTMNSAAPKRPMHR